jgi:hypothetical protein
VEKRSFIWGLMRRLPLATLAAALAYRALGRHEAMRSVLVPQINAGGLPLVYEIVLDGAQPDLLRAVELVARAAAARQPLLLFCKLGKDRTGVVAALVLAACGADNDQIVADYARWGW